MMKIILGIIMILRIPPLYVPKNAILDLETHVGGSIVIVCSSSTSQWNCCNDAACKSISNETIKAPAPSARSAIASPTSEIYSSFISFSASSSSTSSLLVTFSSSSETSSKIDSSPISSSSTTPSPSPSSSLFPGAIAGTSISSVIFLAFLALLTYFLLRNRKNNYNYNHSHKQKLKLNQTKGEAYVKPELAGDSADRGNSGQLAEERVEVGVGRSQAWELQGDGRGGGNEGIYEGLD
ncbi:hypothetical protein BofuT4_P038300.1 [Botrytis cinerea T4]|uniref:Uncharacterized protein n=1 Tax=Botryotinia fuckeliana (strain T4) TaxID=999810 RepID=G2Y2N8_BOTF4|nr:hypothetical protein BofuT4_P038300.1 [Botrytis cinerea T4]